VSNCELGLSLLGRIADATARQNSLSSMKPFAAASIARLSASRYPFRS